MILLELFWAFFQIGLFSFGGGMAALPLIQDQVVDVHGWLTLAEFTDLITISQMTPGPIAINASTFVGTQVAGFAGSVVATLGCVTPSCMIISILAFIYARYKNLDLMQAILTGLRPAVVGLIATAGMAIIRMTFWAGSDAKATHTVTGIIAETLQSLDWFAITIFLGTIYLLRKFRLDPILVMVLCGILGGIYYML